MHRIVIITLSLLIHQCCLAQRPVGVFQPLTIISEESTVTRDYIDTLKPGSFIPQNEGGLGCFTGIYPAPDSGYVTGNNKYGDLQKAQFFSLSKMGYTGPGILQAVQVIAGVKKMLASSDLIYINIYDADTAIFRPGNLIATSNPINLGDIDDSGTETTFTFPAPVSLADSFFVSVMLPQITGDTLAILSTLDQCRTFSGWSWEQWADSTWHTLANSWILDIDLAIFPVMDLPFNVGIKPISSIIQSVSIFPNPASKLSTLQYETTEAARVEILIMNARGKIIKQIVKELLNAGKHSEILNIQQMESGLYHILVISDHVQQVFPLVVE